MKLFLVLTFGGFLFAFGAQAQSIVSNYRVRAADFESLPEIAMQFEVHRRLVSGYEVYVPAGRALEFLALAPSAELVDYDIRAEIKRLRSESPSGFAGYHTFAEVQSEMAKHVATFPAIAALNQYGTSTQGNPLLVLTVSGVKTKREKPTVMITSATHGDELITVEVVLGIIDKIVTSYGKDARITDLVNSHELLFVPVVNPDGFRTQDRYDNGRDPNRSYPWPNNTNNTPTGSIGPIVKMATEKQVDASIDFHASGEMIMYPWAYTYASPPAADELLFKALGNKMAAFNGYAVGQISQIIYLAPGSSADYYYWKLGSAALGIEMANSKVPQASQIAGVLRDNLEATIAFIEHFKG